MLNGKVILITGGTGSFGKKCTEIILQRYKPTKLIIFSRDELKQFLMAKQFPSSKYPCIRYFIGDVRDKERLIRAFQGVDYVIHAAALKQVPALEYNPTEAVKTNVMGANNIVDIAIEAGVKKVIALSTDKAVSPINLYGASKMVAEKIFIAANAYAGCKVKFSVVRYGNVVGSRGSVVPLFIELKKKGIQEFPVTDERMTRFWITLEQGVDFVIRALDTMEGGEVFIPKIPSMRIMDLAKAIQPNCRVKITGIRPGEKIHETLIAEEESRNVKILDDFFVITTQFFETKEAHKKYDHFSTPAEGFVYRSDKNEEWLKGKELNRIISSLQLE